MLEIQSNPSNDTAQQDFPFDKGFTSYAPRSSTGFYGVTKRADNRYQAQLSLNGKQTYLGSFDTPVEAARVYDQWARKIPQMKARVNFEDKNGTVKAEPAKPKTRAKRRRRTGKSEGILRAETFGLSCISALQQMLTAKRLFESFTDEQRSLIKILSKS